MKPKRLSIECYEKPVEQNQFPRYTRDDRRDGDEGAATARSCMWMRLHLEKNFGLDVGLFEDRAQRALGRVAGMVHQRGVAVGRGVEPDFMRTRSLSIEDKAQGLESAHDVAVAETRQSSHD